MAGRASKKPAPKPLLMRTPVSEAEAERRLGPVIDSLSAQQFKKAMKLANQAIQKRPGWPAARALRAIVLLATGHRAEALEAVKAVRDDIDHGRVPLDEDAAARLSLFYTEARMEDEAGALYEQAWGMQPDSVGLAETAFAMYIRSMNYAAAQAVAVKLRRTFPVRARTYSFWTAMASWLSMNPAAGYAVPRDERLLTLAAMYVTKVLGSVPNPTSEEIRFATRLYIDAGKYDDANKLLQRPSLIIDRCEVMRSLGLIAQRAGRLDDAATVYHALLSEFEADDWSHWVQFFKCVDAAGAGREKAWALVDSLREKEMKAKYPSRGPFLAHMELLLREKKWDALREAVLEFFGMFAKKSVCPHDVRPYVAYMVKAEQEGDLFDRLLSIEKMDKGIPRLNRSWLLLWFDRLDESVETLAGHYMSLLDENANPTESQAGDDFVLMAVHKLLPIIPGKSRYADPKNIFRAIAFLEYALSNSPSNYHIKLMLVVLNTALMTVDNAFAIWSELEVKHVQLASLSHLVLRPLFTTGSFDNLDRLHGMLTSLWRECDKDIPEGISRALRAHSMNAVVEFAIFRRRLGRSCVLAEAMNFDILSKLGTPEFNVFEKDTIYTLQGVVPRFGGGKREMENGLITNADQMSLDFWNTEKFVPDRRLKDEHDEDIEYGNRLTKGEMQVVYSHIKATHVVIAVIKGVEPPPEALEAIPENWLIKPACAQQNGDKAGALSEGSTLIDSSARGKFLLSFALSLNSIRHVLLDKGDGNVSDASVDKLKKEGDHLCDLMLDDCDKMQARLVKSWESPETTTLMPQVIEECGSWVCHLLILFTVGIQAMWPLLVQKKKQTRKGSKRSVMDGQTEKASTPEKMESTLKKYKDTAVACCKKLEDILNQAGDKADFKKAVYSEISEAVELLKFLPIGGTPSKADPPVDVDLTGAQVREKLATDISREALASHVMGLIGPSHDASVARMRQRVQDMAHGMSGLKP